ncbi:hypothetical protein MGA5115_03052 [Marinomonas gallaica]|uniref:Uncharacterized protein n=1 Tax=Marinomonas gallaica TaxID=1806667 RepID=A0A1C3JUH8_9GAMM|nr:DUF6586 family protein [Marinomonas gallaica]SBT18891.1 hypothetical protein MGA5115_03052 [Marinomonas gallaica]SBT21846.1 hypothetical protein MGA5116_02456 [Marinomonas gallaica]
MMSSSLASSTNQRLDAARRLLVQSQQEEGEWLMNSYESSAVFQLRSGLNGLLQEVMASYNLSCQVDIDVMVRASEERGIAVPVLLELMQLKSSRQSWLSQLLDTFDAALECRAANQAYSAAGNVELIGRGSDAGGSTKHILSSLTELVLRFREDAAEY